MKTQNENYGQDAPVVTRRLLVIGGLLLACWAALDLLHRQGALPATLGKLRGIPFGPGIAMLLVGFIMIVSSRYGKRLLVRRLVAERAWRGDERVLDVGCGRGLVTVEVARRLTLGGKVTGIDVWSQGDLAGNSAEALLLNASAANVAARIAVDTGDARRLPYADDDFDVVTSATVLHNIKPRSERDRALAEMARVLRPGGEILLFDIVHTPFYATTLRHLGMTDVRLSIPWLLWALPGWRLSARKPTIATPGSDSVQSKNRQRSG